MTETIFSRVDETTLRVIKQAPAPAPEVNEYNLDFLLKQKKDIQAQKDAYDADRDRELAEVDELLSKCDELKIKSEAEVAMIAADIAG